MKKHVLLYGLLGGVLVVVLKFVEYRYLVIEHSMELYGGLIAVVFISLGIWLGLTLTRPKAAKETDALPTEIAPPVAPSIEPDPAKREALGITKRELEILELIAAGLSNREIAERIFVSENTVKTHSSRLFEKLSARRRTQAVQIGKELGLLR